VLFEEALDFGALACCMHIAAKSIQLRHEASMPLASVTANLMRLSPVLSDVVVCLCCCSIAMGCLFVDREKGDGGKQINKEVCSLPARTFGVVPVMCSTHVLPGINS
jgi:hypothetical protein